MLDISSTLSRHHVTFGAGRPTMKRKMKIFINKNEKEMSSQEEWQIIQKCRNGENKRAQQQQQQ